MKSRLIGASLGLALAVLSATSAAAYQRAVGTVYFDWNSSKLNAKALRWRQRSLRERRISGERIGARCRAKNSRCEQGDKYAATEDDHDG